MKYRIFSLSILCILVFCITAFYVPVNATETDFNFRRSDAGQGIVQLTSEKGKPKVLSVVLDNSSSMVKKDGIDEHTTRWIEADYTVKALAAMMDTDDILRLYIMSGYRNDVKTIEMSKPKEITIGKEKEGAIREVEDYLEEMKFCQYTYYQGVTRAARDMGNDLEEGKDCWIVILTDGVFWEKGQGRMDAETLTMNLHAITEFGAYGDSRIRVAYIPIGDKGETADIKENVDNGIYVADVEDSGTGGRESLILKKVTDTINRIYGRVRLELEADKVEKYLPQDEKEKDIRFHFDIPLERLIVFMQHSGTEERYEDYQQRQGDGDSETLDGSNSEIDIGIPTVPSQLVRSDEANFKGRDDLPDYEDGQPSYKLEKVKYKELWGRMLSYVKKSVSQKQFTEQTLIIPVNSESRPDVEVYYQPAVKIGLEYIQNGESVRHVEGCLSSAGGEEHEEYCLQEGKVTVRIKLLDDNGNELTNVDSELLYKDNFSVCIRIVGENEWETMTPTGADYEFEFDLEQKDYQIKVITPWDEQKSGVLKVQEKRKELEIIMPDIEKIMLNESEEGAKPLEIRVVEDGLIPPTEIIEQMTVLCESQDEKLIMIPVESENPGVWLFKPTLLNPQDDTAPQEVRIQISASRPYAIGEPESASDDADFFISSYPEELSVALESEEAVKMSTLLWPFGKERVSLKYLCRNILDEEEKAMVSNQDFHVEPDSIASSFSLGEDGEIYIRRSFLKWFFTNETSSEITFHAAYDLWNTRNETDVVIVLEFHTIPAWVRYLIGVFTLLIVLWITAIIIRNHTYRFIYRVRAVLLADCGARYSLKQNRRRHCLNPFCNYCLLLYENGKQVENPIMPDLRLQIRNNRLGNGYEIFNYTDFADANRFAIKGKAINKNNRIFDNTRKFSVRDNEDIKFYLVIEK